MRFKAYFLGSRFGRLLVHPIDVAKRGLEAVNDVYTRRKQLTAICRNLINIQPIMTLVPFSLESPPNVWFTKYLPAANPSASSVRPMQYSPLSPTAPFLIPVNASRRERCACHASVSIPRNGESVNAARVTRYASMMFEGVSSRISANETAYCG